MGKNGLDDRLKALRQRLLGPTETKKNAGADEKKTVMIVDDDEDNLRSLERHLSEDFAIVACSSGEEGVGKFREAPVRISGVIRVIKMRGMSGTRAAKLIRNNDPFVPIIFRTGYSDEYPEHEILDQYEGSVDYVTKG